jgi:hypothetical protein
MGAKCVTVLVCARVYVRVCVYTAHHGKLVCRQTAYGQALGATRQARADGAHNDTNHDRSEVVSVATPPPFKEEERQPDHGSHEVQR